MVGRDEGVAAVVDGAHQHAQREHVGQRAAVPAKLHLRSQEVQVRLRHLGNFARPRLHGDRLLAKNKEKGCCLFVCNLPNARLEGSVWNRFPTPV